MVTLSLRLVAAVAATLILWGAGHQDTASAGQASAPAAHIAAK